MGIYYFVFKLVKSFLIKRLSLNVAVISGSIVQNLQPYYEHIAYTGWTKKAKTYVFKGIMLYFRKTINNSFNLRLWL